MVMGDNFTAATFESSHRVTIRASGYNDYDTLFHRDHLASGWKEQQVFMDGILSDTKFSHVVFCHYEYMVRRLLRRIAEGAVKAEDCLFIYYEIGKKPRILTVDQYGSSPNMPSDLFYPVLDEVVATRRAELERRIADESEAESNKCSN